jgi:uracil-DNA glycosylase family 4
MDRIGFFDLGSGENPNHDNTKKASVKIGCDACDLKENCENPKMSRKGKGEKGILIVTEWPTEKDDEAGTYLAGRSGRFLKEILEDNGIDFKKDCYITGAVKCHCPSNKANNYLNHCRSALLKDIAEIEPKLIITLGTAAIQGVLGHRLNGRIIGKGFEYSNFFGENIPDQELKTFLCPTYSPVYLLKYDDPVIRKQFEEHITNALKLLNADFPEDNPKIKTTTDKIQAIEWLQEVSGNRRVTFDYETTGIKPDRDGHEIVCVSIVGDDFVYSFPFFQDDEFRKLFFGILHNRRIGKIAHNITFENSWTQKFSGEFAQRWVWDTCLGAHCQQNTKPNNLKFQVYINFGVLGYDIDADPFITGTKPGDNENSKNSFNRINECDINKLLYYCGQDSYYSRDLYYIQKAKLLDFQKEGMKLLLKGNEVLSRVHRTGMHIDMDMLEEQYRRTDKRIQKKEEELREFDEWKEYGSFDFNIDSNKQLGKLLYDILEYPKPGGKRKVDEGALNDINTPFTKTILERKKLIKMRDTYFDGFRREQINGIVRAFFNLNTVKTFRGSANAPNFQNIPKHNEAIKKIVRSLIIPRPGNRIIEYDYKGVEVSVGACYHKDRNMINYILDESTDMHRDTCMDIFFRGLDDFTKQERQIAKNSFVFPSFYGSSTYAPDGEIGNITQNLWDDAPETTMLHLKDNGIKNIRDFQSHVEDIEKKFWEERFPEYDEWKNQTYKQYKKDGYVDLYTGFRCYGPMKKTQVCNYPIQGSAFHCLLWNLIQVEEAIKNISGRSMVIGQIHDAIVVDCHPEDEPEVDRLIKLWGTEKIREHWDWIMVPLKIEKERGAVDGSWAVMEDCGYV